jgi:hypothetical protein
MEEWVRNFFGPACPASGQLAEWKRRAATGGGAR